MLFPVGSNGSMLIPILYLYSGYDGVRGIQFEIDGVISILAADALETRRTKRTLLFIRFNNQVLVAL